MSKKHILVTGGAGYIGSHTCRQLVDAGYRVVVLDNLCAGRRLAVPEEAVFIQGDAGDQSLVRSLLTDHSVDAVIHFAAHLVVPEAVADPLKYYTNNTCVSRALIEACTMEGLTKFIFSSSAAVYGIPRTMPVNEGISPLPINPYGTSKLMTEWMLRDVAAADSGFTSVALRYFNVAGARADGTLGQVSPEATHLIKIASQAACGMRDGVAIFGTDYPTPDGTCIRDYIHVDDLARAHLDALVYLEHNSASQTLNCGYGRGFSVREVLDTMQRVSGVRFTVREEARRPGDTPELIADATRIRKVLGWKPVSDDIELMCRSAYQWEQKLGARDNTGKFK
jgi:UDP-glucose 4-epimerase